MAAIDLYQVMLIDTHAHIYVEEFDNDREDIIQRSDNEGVEKILLPAIDGQYHQRLLSVCQQYPGKCFPMMGLHPCSVKENYLVELKVVEDYLFKGGFVAVGEIGLDFYWDTSFTAQQFEAFSTQIRLAMDINLPIVIHSRNSIDACIDVVTENQKGQLNGVFHCFSGTAEQARKITGLGFYLGIGGVLTFKKSGLDQVIKEVPLEYIVLETDAPYLAPVPFRGKRNESSYLRYIVKKLAEIKSLSEQEIEAITTNNAIKLFRL